MNKLLKCTNCGFVCEDNKHSDKCPNCNAGKENFSRLSDEDITKIYQSNTMNNIHMELISLVDQVTIFCKEGLDER